MLIICLGGWEKPRQNVCTNLFVILNYLRNTRLLLLLGIFPGRPWRASCQSFWSVLMLFLDVQRSGQTVTKIPVGCIARAFFLSYCQLSGEKKIEFG